MKLSEVRLFENTNIDLNTILVKEYPNHHTIEFEGDISKYIGIVLEGKIFINAYSLAGKTFIINTLTPGMIFGDVLLFGSKSNVYPGNVITKGKTVIAIIPNDDVKWYINNNPTFLNNFLSLLSDKVYSINRKSKLLSQDSIRDKIQFFLHQEMKNQGSNKIRLNMTKEELANILFVQRPSLSRELIKMRDEGMIEFDRWSITLLSAESDSN